MKKNIFKYILFIVLFIIIFEYVQLVLTEKHRYPNGGEDVKYSIEGLEALQENTVEILFLGTSHVDSGISPMQLYHQHQITSYNLATSGQTIEESYYLLEKFVQNQTPKVVVLDASCMFFDEYWKNASWRYIIDSLCIDEVKIEAAKVYSEIWGGDGALSVFFPIIKYHTRWSSLNYRDFQDIDCKSGYYSAGQFIRPEVNNIEITIEEMNDSAKVMKEKGIYEAYVRESNIEWLCKIKELCEKYGMQLLMTKVPSIQLQQDYESAWTADKYNMVKNICSVYNVDYYDLMYDGQLNLDYANDSADGGMHLNVRGAMKVTEALSEYIIQKYEIYSIENEVYNTYLETYKCLQDVAVLESTIYLQEYLTRLANEDYTIFLIGCNDIVKNMQATDLNLISTMENIEIEKCAMNDSYVAVIDNGNVKYDLTGARKIELDYNCHGSIINIIGGGDNSGEDSSLVYNGEEYCLKNAGLNIVVIDNMTGKVIDSVVFSINSEGNKATRNSSKIHGYFRDFELCFLLMNQK